MTDTLPHIYAAHLQQLRESPFLWERVGRQLRPLYWKELGSRMSLLARGLDALGVTRQDRVCVLTRRGTNCFLAHLCAWMLGAVTVCFSRAFTPAQYAPLIRESRSKVIFVDNVEQVEEVLGERDMLPDVTHIVVMEGIGTERGVKPAVLTFLELMDKGKAHPDRTVQSVRQIQPSDRALLMYSPGLHTPQASMLTHKDILERIRHVEQSLATQSAGRADTVIVTSSFHESPLHVAAAFLPMLAPAQLCYVMPQEWDMQEYAALHPDLIIGESDFFALLRKDALLQAEEEGAVDHFLMREALAIGKARFERPNRLRLRERIMNRLLRNIFIRKFHTRLGGRLRATVCVDANVSYDTQLFFHSFGVEMMELDTGI